MVSFSIYFILVTLHEVWLGLAWIGRSNNAQDNIRSIKLKLTFSSYNEACCLKFGLRQQAHACSLLFNWIVLRKRRIGFGVILTTHGVSHVYKRIHWSWSLWINILSLFHSIKRLFFQKVCLVQVFKVVTLNHQVQEKTYWRFWL